jgi:VWFA-related protein
LTRLARLAALTGLSLLGAWSAAQDRPLAFPAETALVAVDVSVVDSRGRPVGDLGPGDFELTVDDRPRRVASVEFVRLGAAPGAPPAEATAPLGYATNEGAARGRLIVLAVDQGSFRAGLIRDVTLAADRLLDQLTPEDRVGLVAFPPPGPSVEMTADHAEVRKALTRVAGRITARLARVGLVEALDVENQGARWQAALERECPADLEPSDLAVCVSEVEGEAVAFAADHRSRAETSRRTLKALFDALAGIEGPKTVVLVSQGLDVDAPGELAALGRAAGAARVALFVLRLDRGGDDAGIGRPSPTAGEDRAQVMQGLDGLAAHARGAVFNVTASAENAFARVAEELSGYYLLGFEPEAGDRDDRDHAIGVMVRPRGLTVRARRSVRIEAAPSAADAPKSLAATLRSPFPLPDVPLRAAVFSLPAPSPDAVRLLIAAERAADEPGPALFGYAVFGPKGDLVSSGQRSVETRGSVLAADVPPGPYVLRVAVVDGRGRRGSLETRVEARLGGGAEVALGDLMLVPPALGTPAVVPEPGPDGRLSAVLELQTREGKPFDGVTVSFEVADDREGAALISAAGPLEKASGGRGWIAQGALGLGALPPGEYVARATVTREGRVLGRATRPLRLPERAPRDAGAPLEIRKIRAAEVYVFLPQFDRRSVLVPELLRYVFARMDAVAGVPAAPAVAEARARALAGAFESLAEGLGNAQEPSPSPHAALLRGLQLLAAGQVQGAEFHFKAALAQASELVVAAIHIGACEAAQSKDRQAIGAWKTALITEPEAPVLRQLLAEALLRVDEPGEAATLLDEELKRRPTPALERSRALALAQAGRGEEALPLLDAVLDRDPGDLAALYLSLRLAFDDYAQRGALSPFSRDPERLTRYARAYVAAKGPQQEVVARWLRFLEKR